MATRQPSDGRVFEYTRGRHRNLEGALGALQKEPKPKVKLLVDDDGSFTAVLIDGLPNIISLPRRGSDGRDICHRYIKTGLRTEGYEIYVLHEVTGDDIQDIIATLGKKDPAIDWFDESKDESSWLRGHRAGRSDLGFGRTRYLPRAAGGK